MKPETLARLGEEEILDRLLPYLPGNDSLLVGPGDDCAVVTRDHEFDTLLKTDCIVEGIHFTRETSPGLIGRKALARNLSDIAAMGGSPEHALVTVMIHPERTMKTLEDIYEGLTRLACEWNVSVAGGETTSLPTDGLALSIALTGKVPKGQAICRSHASPGDLIVVTGELGDTFHSGHHLTFPPRIREGILLREAGIPSAMMDISDGLAADLPRMARSSGTGFRIDETLLPCRNGCSPLQAVRDGEDYELLFTIPPGKLPLLEQIRRNLPHTPLTIIGTMTPPEQGDTIDGGWIHFSSSPKD